MTGWVRIVGLGPGDPVYLAPAADETLVDATDIVGYTSYLRMVPEREGQQRHGSDNREELDRAAHALDLAASGHRVAVVSSGDPGVFAMAAAIYEALDGDREGRWDAVDVSVVPGITAALALASRVGAPLGHDWCCLSLSDNLKPWDVIEQRLAAAASADFVLALYNPISKHRPWQLGRALELIGEHRAPETPVVVGRDVTRDGETVAIVELARLDPALVDMRTVLIVGSSATRVVEGRGVVYTPRRYDSALTT